VTCRETDKADRSNGRRAAATVRSSAASLISTNDERAAFANNAELGELVRNFGIGNIRSASISTVWW
jgi:hypothetical protein